MDVDHASLRDVRHGGVVGPGLWGVARLVGLGGPGHIRRRLVPAAALIPALLLSACTSDSGDSPGGAAEPDAAVEEEPANTDVAQDAADELALRTDGVLTVCTEASYPPFDYPDEDSPLGYSGFDIELIAEVAASLELGPPEFVEVGFEDIASGAVFEAERCDVAASAISITPARAERLAFTEPHYVSRRALLVPTGSPIATLEDLERGMVLGVQYGTPAADRAMEEVDDAEIRTYDDGESVYEALAAGEVDAVLVDHAVARVWAEQDGDLEVVEEFRRVDRLGFAVSPRRDDALLEMLDRSLIELREDGTYDELFERYFGVDA